MPEPSSEGSQVSSSVHESSPSTDISMEIEDVPEFNLDSLHNAALAADRYSVSNRAAAAVINGFQVDTGRLTDGSSQNVVDQKKI